MSKKRTRGTAADAASEYTGAAAGGMLAALVADTVLTGGLASAGGVLITRALKYAASEINGRVLARREVDRVEAVLIAIRSGVDAQIVEGRTLRSDDFFDQPEDGQLGKADQIAEHTLMKCQQEPEEKKIPYIGQMFARIPFDQSVGVELAHQMLKCAEQLTYRQLCVLSIAKTGKFKAMLRSDDYRGQGSFRPELLQILYEVADLYHRGLVNFGGEVLFGPSDVKPGAMVVQGMGVWMASLMGLADIPEDDLLPIVSQLRE